MQDTKPGPELVEFSVSGLMKCVSDHQSNVKWSEHSPPWRLTWDATTEQCQGSPSSTSSWPLDRGWVTCSLSSRVLPCTTGVTTSLSQSCCEGSVAVRRAGFTITPSALFAQGHGPSSREQFPAANPRPPRPSELQSKVSLHSSVFFCLVSVSTPLGNIYLLSTTSLTLAPNTRMFANFTFL